MIVAGVTFSLCSASLLPLANSVGAATVVESNAYKSITLFNKADILAYTGLSLTNNNATSVYHELTKASTWEAAGYNKADAATIARDFGRTYSKSINLLNKMNYNEHLHLKVILITKGYVKAEFGLQNYYLPENETPETEKPNSEKPETETPEVEKPEVQANLKKLDIDVDYSNGQVQLQYQVNANGTIKAQYQDKANRIQLQGAAAQEKIEGIISGLNLKTASQQEITTHILKKLNRGTSYKQFQFQGQFTDNTQVKFKLK